MTIPALKPLKNDPLKIEHLYFVYDGDCPICRYSADIYVIKKSVGRIETIDARVDVDHPVMHEIRATKLDLDQGMVIKYKADLYHGRDALVFLAKHGASDDFLNSINHTIYRHKFLATISYPFFKLARRIALWATGKKLFQHNTP